jgi:hypothetical protein
VSWITPIGFVVDPSARYIRAALGIGMGATTVGVLAHDDEARSVDALLTGLGGVSRAVSDEALVEASAAAAPTAGA